MTLALARGYILERLEGGVVFRCAQNSLRILFYSDCIARVTYTGDKPFSDRTSQIVTCPPRPVAVELDEDAISYSVSSGQLTITVNKATGALSYFGAADHLLLREPERGGRWLTPRPVTRNVFDKASVVDTEQSVDGARADATDFTAVFDRDAYEAKLELLFAPDEALFGLGSHEEGYANLRGRSRELYQQNMKAVIPHLVSSRGYGILVDCGSLMTFHDDALGSYFWTDCVDELDFYFISGGSYSEVLRGYRSLTGTVPLPPKWAFGYVQSKERYVTADEMVDVVAEYRRREIPLDTIVLDWKSWPNGEGWGQKSLDPLRFPSPDGFVRRLHEMNARLMVSIWPIMTGGCDDQLELRERGLMLGNNSTYNAFDKEARDLYWRQAERGLFSHGVDAWWCDCTEPFEADWAGAVKPEPHQRLALNTRASKLYLDAAETNLYSLMHSRGIYEGQRRASNARVLNLTRSSYAGQSRYGTFTWNGDVCATWETLRRSVAEALNFCATGEPYWTTDIGGFFIDDRSDLWFWRGNYPRGCRGLTAVDALVPDSSDTGCTDLGFHELYVRWLQWAAFLPMMRSHGTDAAREIWRFGEPGTPFYDAIEKNIRLRYRILPYIYSVAATVTFDCGSMVTALPLLFPEDMQTHYIADQYMFGPSLMICPVTKPMLYGPGSVRLETKPQVREVYLPETAGWYYFSTEEFFAGGRSIEPEAPLDRIPVFVRSGSIVPMTIPMQFVDELPDAPYELRIYGGADAFFTLYEDDGTTYDYERGSCSRVAIHWEDATLTATLSPREGSFVGMTRERNVDIVLITPEGRAIVRTRYTGEELHHTFGRSGVTAS